MEPITLTLAVSVVLCLVSWTLLLTRGWARPRRSRASLVAMLRRIPFLAGLDEARLLEIAKVVREVHVPENIFVIREQRPGESMYLVVSGQLHILKRGALDQTLVQTVGPGELVGEMALLNDARRVASARAVVPSVLLQIDRDDFFALLEAQPELARAVWDACEQHTIELALADSSHTRSLAVDVRKRWIAGRQSVVAKPGDVVTTATPRYLAVVAGAVGLDGRELRPPQMVRLTPGQQAEILEPARLCWLEDRA